jgi:YVTN family beta-propeller protein
VTTIGSRDVSSSVTVIGTLSNWVVETILVGDIPQAIAITPDGAYAYVAMFLSNSLWVINTGSNQVVGQPIPVGGAAEGIAVISHPNVIINFGPVFWTAGSIYALPGIPITFAAPVDDPSLVASVTWDFYGDGTVVDTTPTLTTEFAYTRAGTFTPTVTVALADGSEASATTTMRVQSLPDAVSTAVSLVDWLALPAGHTNSLISKLTAATTAIARGALHAACNELQAFENEVRALVRAGHVDDASATPRLGQAEAIQFSLGCS